MESCRCGWDGDGPHPCHGDGYRCRAPAERRYYVPGPASLAGVQMKLSMAETWACDACWARFQDAAEKAARKSVQKERER